MRMLEACVSLLEDKLYLLKRKDSTCCDMKVVQRRLADAKGDIKELPCSFHRDPVGLYAII